MKSRDKETLNNVNEKVMVRRKVSHIGIWVVISATFEIQNTIYIVSRRIFTKKINIPCINSKPLANVMRRLIG